MMESDFRLLRSFVAVAEELHMGRAARRLNIAQPPLSRRIQRLEREMDVRLFDRQRRGVNLTTAGREFLVEARAILQRGDAAVSAARGAAHGETGLLRIGFVESATASGVLPAALLRLHQRRPGLRCELRELPSALQIAGLRREEIDVGLIYNRPADLRGLCLRPILPGRCIAVVSRRHPLARTALLSLRSLAGQPLILWRRDLNPPRYDAIVAAVARAARTPVPVLHADQIQTIVGLAAAGLGIGLVPDSCASVRMDVVVYRRVRGLRVLMDLELVWRQGDESPALREFLRAAGAEEPRQGPPVLPAARRMTPAPAP